VSACRPRRWHGAAAPLRRETRLPLRHAHGLLPARGTPRPAAAPLLAASRPLHRRALGGDPRRDALHRRAVVAPAWRRAPRPPAGPERSGRRVAPDRCPTAAAARHRRAATIGAAGWALLPAASAPAAPPDVRAALAVEVLRPGWRQP
jgi:hypothetical protein